VEAARFQQSAFSGRLPNEHRKHAFDFDSLLHQFFIVIGPDIFQVTNRITGAPKISMQAFDPEIKNH
jgi:hypothetical protein